VPERQRLVDQIRGVDFDELETLFGLKEEKTALPEESRIAALPRPEDDPAQRQRHRERGEQAFRKGAVAFLVVAGGQGSRLGFEHPKGMFLSDPCPKSRCSRFIRKNRGPPRRYSAPLPFLVMTSPATDEETRRFFGDQHHFGLPREDVIFFCQGTMPALDLKTGKLLMDSKAELFLSPTATAAP